MTHIAKTPGFWIADDGEKCFVKLRTKLKISINIHCWCAVRNHCFVQESNQRAAEHVEVWWIEVRGGATPCKDRCNVLGLGCGNQNVYNF